MRDEPLLHTVAAQSSEGWHVHLAHVNGRGVWMVDVPIAGPYTDREAALAVAHAVDAAIERALAPEADSYGPSADDRAYATPAGWGQSVAAVGLISKLPRRLPDESAELPPSTCCGHCVPFSIVCGYCPDANHQHMRPYYVTVWTDHPGESADSMQRLVDELSAFPLPETLGWEQIKRVEALRDRASRLVADMATLLSDATELAARFGGD